MIDSNEAKLRAMEGVARKFFRESLDAREACGRLAESHARQRSATLQRQWPLAARCVHTLQLVRAWLLALLMLWLEALTARVRD